MINIVTTTTNKAESSATTTTSNSSGFSNKNVYNTTEKVNPVTIWGQRHDHESDITGDLISNGKIQSNSVETTEITTNNLTSNNAVFETLQVTKEAVFYSLLIEKIKSVGGTIILTMANAKFDIVEQLENNNYKCYWRANDGTKTITNDFIVNDQIYCKTYNLGSENKYYWRVCVEVGTETLIDENDHEELYNYMVLSDTIKDGSSVPERGDEVVLLGHRGSTATDRSKRRCAIILASSYSPDTSLNTPSLCFYTEITSFADIKSRRHTYISPSAMHFKGTMMAYDSTNKTYDNVGLTYAKKSEVSATADEIKLAIYNDLNETGISITDGTITLNGDTTNIIGNLNLKDSNNGLIVFDSEGNAKIQIRANQVGDLETFDYFTDVSKSASYQQNAPQYYEGTLPKIEIGSFENGDTITIKNITIETYCSSATLPTKYPISSETYLCSFKIYNAANDTLLTTLYSNLIRVGDGIYQTTTPLNYTMQQDANVYIVCDFSLNETTSISAQWLPQYYLNVFLNCTISEKTAITTKIGLDGFLSRMGTAKMFGTNTTETLLRWGNDAIKLNNNGIQRGAFAKQQNGNNILQYVPFNNYTNVFSPDSFTPTTLATGSTKNAYQIKLSDNGICNVVTGAASETWLILPNETYTDNDTDTITIPIGYKIKIVNSTALSTAQSIGVVVSSTTSRILQGVNSSLYISVTDTAELIYVGKYNSLHYWRKV